MAVDNVGNFMVIQNKNSYNIRSTNMPLLIGVYSWCYILFLTNV